MRKYIELTEYDNNGRTVVSADSIQGLCRTRLGDKEVTEVIVSGYPLLVNEPIDEILEKMESDQGHLDGIDVLDKIRAEIAEYGSICVAYAIADKTKTDKGIEKLVADVLSEAKRQVLDIIDHYKTESEAQE